MVLCATSARSDDGEAVSATVSASYARVRMSDGSFQPETYTFGEGGFLPGPVRDDSIDQLTFMDVARAVARPLASRNYVPVADRNPEKTKLLIMVYWGITHGTAASTSSSASQRLQDKQGSTMTPPPLPTGAYMAHCTCDPSQLTNTFSYVAGGAGKDNEITGAFAVVAAEDRMRSEADMRNAALLGYGSELAATSGLQLTAFKSRRDDLIAEIEDNRDFVVLQAYDFQTLWKHKKRNLLWVARMSVRERGTDFATALPAMVGNASKYFGVDSRGLVRASIPEGRVEIGDVKSLGVVPEK